MRPERISPTGFIRGHCGSVANEAPSDRATGAQRQVLKQLPSVHLQRTGTRFPSDHPAGEALPPGKCLLRLTST